MDDNMHGTHVAGIIAAQQNNGIGVSGVAPNVSVAACKFLDASGSGDTAGAILCLNYYRALATRAVNPVNIIATNNSWAGGPYSQALYDAIKANQDAGILFMAAASNDGQNNDSVETYPSNFYLPNLISVAATDNNDKLANFSNYGKVSVAVAAPGVDILATVPNGKYAYLSGTSMATPHVTGLAGLIASYRPSLSWIGIKNLILTGGESVSGANGTTYTGRRILAAGPNGTGSLTCSNQKIVKRVWPRASTVTVKLGQSVALGILSVQCENPTITVGGMSAAAAAASPIRLTDTGTGVDLVAGDGIFSGTWTPSARGTFRLAFPGNDIVTVKVQ
jgi:subtilisin family serine protease